MYLPLFLRTEKRSTPRQKNFISSNLQSVDSRGAVQENSYRYAQLLSTGYHTKSGRLFRLGADADKIKERRDLYRDIEGPQKKCQHFIN